jgi:hypothetical protein
MAALKLYFPFAMLNADFELPVSSFHLSFSNYTAEISASWNLEGQTYF